MVKQQKIIDKGVKVLSLFFIDKVASYIDGNAVRHHTCNNGHHTLRQCFEFESQSKGPSEFPLPERFNMSFFVRAVSDDRAFPTFRNSDYPILGTTPNRFAFFWSSQKVVSAKNVAIHPQIGRCPF